MRRVYYIVLVWCLALLSGCNDMHDFPRDPWQPDVQEPAMLYVLCEGLFNMNNSTLARYDLEDGTVDTDYFRSANKRGLGDTANEMKEHDGRLFIVVNVSSRIEVVDLKSGVSVQQLPLFDENGVARQPRQLIFHEGKGYVSCFDGHVLRIDMGRLEVDGVCRVGRNPEGLCVANGKLYVANSGGLDYPNYDNRVSVVDLQRFEEMYTIEVAKNPGDVHADSQGDVYVSSRGDYGDTPYTFQKIDTEIDKVVRTFEMVQALKFKIVKDYAYIYNYDFVKKSSWIKLFDCLTEEVVRDNFISDGTELHTPFGIDVDAVSGDVYVTDAYNFVIWGDVLCFSADGKLKYRLDEVGLNPNAICIIKKNEIEP